MAAQKGKLMLLKLSNGASPLAYNAIAGLRQTSVTINDEVVDVTNKDSPNSWRELLEGAGTKSCSVSGSGVFKDDVYIEAMRAAVFSGTHKDMQVAFPNGDTLTGSFHITSFERTGEYNGAEQYSITLDLAGEPVFTAAV